MKLQILGTGCPRCRELERIVRTVADGMHLDYTMEKVDTVNGIVAMGVMSTPALAIDGIVMSTGRIPSEDEIREFLLTGKD